MRTITFLLLCIIVFLSGVVIGNQKEQKVIVYDSIQSSILAEDKENHFSPSWIQSNELEGKYRVDYTMLFDETTEKSILPKIASMIEQVVTVFYEWMVQILYEISSLFIGS